MKTWFQLKRSIGLKTILGTCCLMFGLAFVAGANNNVPQTDYVLLQTDFARDETSRGACESFAGTQCWEWCKLTNNNVHTAQATGVRCCATSASGSGGNCGAPPRWLDPIPQ